MEFKPSKLGQTFQTSIFTELAQYKKQKMDQGIEMIDLSIGSPDLPPPDFVIDALIEHCKDVNQYGYSLKGSAEFHKAVQFYYQKTFGVSLNEETEILQLMGSQDGLVHLPMVLADQGDIILVPDPGYTAYEAGVKMADANMYPMPLLKENQFLPDLEQIPVDVAKKAKVMILNFPGNPVPALANEAFFMKVIQFAKEHEIIVVHDLAYSELTFDNEKALSFLQFEGAKDVGIEFNSLSKSFNMAGARVAYMAGNEQIVSLLSKLKSNLDYGVFSPVQKAATLALLKGEDFLESNRNVYMRRRDVLVKGLRQLGWNVAMPKATMFIWAEIPKGYTSKQFTYELMDKANVVVTPGIAFGEYGEGYVRIALVQSEDQLTEAVNRIKSSKLFN